MHTLSATHHVLAISLHGVLPQIGWSGLFRPLFDRHCAHPALAAGQSPQQMGYVA
jgi:hypothetical protein